MVASGVRPPVCASGASVNGCDLLGMFTWPLCALVSSSEDGNNSSTNLTGSIESLNISIICKMDKIIGPHCETFGRLNADLGPCSRVQHAVSALVVCGYVLVPSLPNWGLLGG